VKDAIYKMPSRASLVFPFVWVPAPDITSDFICLFNVLFIFKYTIVNTLIIKFVILKACV